LGFGGSACDEQVMETRAQATGQTWTGGRCNSGDWSLGCGSVGRRGVVMCGWGAEWLRAVCVHVYIIS
jgi:hypothetical protein